MIWQSSPEVTLGTALPEIARRLLAAGREPATPAAVICRGTTAVEEVVTGTLADIARRAAHLSAPCTIVIGEVVRLPGRTGPPTSPRPSVCC